jgi:hypothetical protein
MASTRLAENQMAANGVRFRRFDKFLLLFAALVIAGSATGCVWFPESTFRVNLGCRNAFRFRQDSHVPTFQSDELLHSVAGRQCKLQIAKCERSNVGQGGRAR